MNTLLHIGLSNALAAALLALLALAVGSLVRRPALTHALWLLVLVKLLTPPLVWIPVPWPVAAEAPPAAAPEEPAAPSAPLPPVRFEMEPLEAMDRPNGPVVILDEELAPVERPVEEPAPRVTAPEPSSSPAGLVAVVWLGGTLVWLSLALVRLHRFRRLLRFARPAAANLQERARKLAEALKLGRCPGVYLLPGRLAPMIWAAGGRPRLLLPVGLAEQLDERSLDTLLLHELAHLRRRDHWVRGLELLVLALYWWHPFAWLARRELREAEEQCCDAWVVASLPGSQRTYATALVDALDFLSAAPVVPPLATGLGQVSDLKRRLTMIMRGTTPRALSWSGCLAVLAVAALLPLLPAWAQAQQPKPEPEDGKRVLIRTEPGEGQPVRIRIGSDEGLDKARAELERLEAELKQKLSEVEKAREKLHFTARFTRVEKKTPEGRNVRYLITSVPGGKDARWVVQEVPGGGKVRYVPVAEPAPVVRFRVNTRGTDIEIIGLDDKPEVRKKVIDLLEKALPRGRRVIILCGGGLQATRIHTAPVKVEERREPVRIQIKKDVAFPIEGERKGEWRIIQRKTGLIEDQEKVLRPASVEALQKQLEGLRREVEKMRKEMKRSEPARPEANNPNAEELQRLRDELKRAQAQAAEARDLAEKQQLRAAQAEKAARLQAEEALQQLRLAEKRLEEARRAREAKQGEDSTNPRKP